MPRSANWSRGRERCNEPRDPRRAHRRHLDIEPRVAKLAALRHVPRAPRVDTEPLRCAAHSRGGDGQVMRIGKKLAAAAARHAMQNNAARAIEKQDQEALLARTVLYALMRKEGRVRISQADIAALKEADTIDFDVDDENGVILATYRVG